MLVSQPVYRGGRTGAEIDSAMNTILAARSRLAETEQSVLLTAIFDYLDVATGLAKVDLTRGYEADAAKFASDTRGRMQYGAVTLTDVAQAESAAARATADRQQAEGSLAVAQATYLRDIGKPPGTLVLPDTHPALPALEDEVLSLAANANPAVESASFTERAAEADVEAARGQLLPTLSLNASILHQSDIIRVNATEPNSLALARGPSNDYRVVAQLVIPLYDGGKSFSLTRQASQTVSARQSEIDIARRNAVNLAASAWESLQSVHANLASLRAEVTADEAGLDGVIHEAGIGQRTVNNVLIAQEALFRSRMALADAQRDELLKEYTVAAAIGQLNADHLLLPVQRYEPKANFEFVRDKWFGLETFDLAGRPSVAAEAGDLAGGAANEVPAAPTEAGAADAASASAGTLGYARTTSVASLPNETSEFRAVSDARPTAPEGGFDERAERNRRRDLQAERAKWMEYGSGE